jgi:uncharacterized membrane protein
VNNTILILALASIVFGVFLLSKIEENELSKPKSRIEGLSDLVFGLALSIGSIALIQHIPQAPGDLITDVLNFSFSFLIIAAIWFGYTRVVSFLAVETSGTLFLKFAILFCVALEPFLYYVFQTTAFTFLDFSSAAFALDTGAMMGLLSVMMYLVVRQEIRGKLQRVPSRSIRRFKVSMVSQAIGAAIFLASISDIVWIKIPIFGYLRFLMWDISLAIYFVSRAIASLREKRNQ